MNCCQKCAFNWNKTNDSEDAEFITGKDDWSQLRAGLWFPEYVYYESDDIMLEVQTLKLMMGEMFIPDASEVEEEDDSGKRETSS